MYERKSPKTIKPGNNQGGWKDGRGWVGSRKWGRRSVCVCSLSCMDIVSRPDKYWYIPPIPGQNTPGFHPRGRHCLHQARSAVRCLAGRMKGEVSCILLTTDLVRGTPGRRTGFSCMWITVSNYFVSFSVCGHFQK